MSSITQIHNFLTKATSANTEEAKKQLFYNLLMELFAKDGDAKEIIGQMADGAEKAVFNIPNGGRNKTGRADSQYRKVIIEFEKTIAGKVKLDHAEFQLKEYFAGNWNTGNQYDFTLIATDCINWAVYGVKPESFIGTDSLDPHQLELKIVDSFVLDKSNANDFFHFVDRYLFKFEKQQPTLDSIRIDFGDTSGVFMSAMQRLREVFSKIKDEQAMQTAYKEWNKFLSVAYGSFEATPDFFLVHTYLSVFSKLLAYNVITNDDHVDDKEMQGVVDGSIFRKLNVSNFVENDFYNWVAKPEYYSQLKTTIRELTTKIGDYDFSNVQSDILKGVYQELIDLETRHALGEYYTPDWLCETVVNHFDFEADARILDPSCGSGSFLMAASKRMRTLHPDKAPDEITSQIVGIDIHPLSVQVAKTTLLLSLGSKVLRLKKPINLQVYLANSLISPEGIGFLKDEFFLKMAGKTYQLPEYAFENNTLYDNAIAEADDLAELTKNQKEEKLQTLNNILKRLSPDIKPELVERFYQIYLGMKQAKEEGKDSIWRFIMQNSYKPFFLKGKCDYIVGNPPWFTYSSIKNADYQMLLRRLATDTNTLPDKKANMPHLEIAAIFMAYAAKYFLKHRGKLAFVLPRSFISAEHHDNTRANRTVGFQLQEVWDLKEVQPLFNVPSCVMFGTRHIAPPKITDEGLPGKSLKGRIKRHNATLAEVSDKLQVTDVRWYYTKLNKSSALVTAHPGLPEGEEKFSKATPYKEAFKQGATIVPRNFYFVSANGPLPEDMADRQVWIESDEANQKDAKEPWKPLKLEGHVEGQYLFRSAIAKNIVPYALIQPPLVVLPLRIDLLPAEIKGGPARKKIVLLTHELVRKAGHTATAKWFKQSHDFWEKYKTEASGKMGVTDRLNFQRGLTDQDLNAPYLVLYTASAKDANAVVVERKDLDLEFLVDHKAYLFHTNVKEEAYYVCSFLNSTAPNKQIKDFQSRGLFGPRDIHKKILDVPFPKFDAANPVHQKLAALSQTCHEKARAYIAAKGYDVGEYSVGKVRLEVKRELKGEMGEVDEVMIGMI